MAEEGVDKREAGREVFLERAWQWKEFTHDRILVAGRLAGMGVALSAALAQRAVDALQKKKLPQ